MSRLIPDGNQQVHVFGGSWDPVSACGDGTDGHVVHFKVIRRFEDAAGQLGKFHAEDGSEE